MSENVYFLPIEQSNVHDEPSDRVNLQQLCRVASFARTIHSTDHVCIFIGNWINKPPQARIPMEAHVYVEMALHAECLLFHLHRMRENQPIPDFSQPEITIIIIPELTNEKMMDFAAGKNVQILDFNSL